MDENSLTVVFNEFSVVDETGAQVPSTDGRKLADFMYGRFALGFGELDLLLPYELRPPSHTCPIEGATRSERAKNAARLAEDIHADVIIYGVISATLPSPQLTLAFDVSTEGFERFPELAGPYALGRSLMVELPFDPEKLQPIEHPSYLVRSEVLSLLTIGLAYLSADNPERALELFEDVRRNRYWPDSSGKEISHALLGKGTARKASIEGSTGPLPTAVAHYEAALAINPEYLRAQLGLADVRFLMAADTSKIESGEHVGLLAEVEAAFSTVLSEALEQANADIELRAQLGLGKTFAAQGLTTRDKSSFGPAREALGRVIAVLDCLEGTPAPGTPDCEPRFRALAERISMVGSLAGQAHYFLALIAEDEGDVQAAIDHYALAIELASPFYKAAWLAGLGSAYCDNGDLTSAEEAYETAIGLAELHSFATTFEELLAEQENLTEDRCQPPSE
jgi:tetratricopeptide (TPR) repeat protein